MGGVTTAEPEHLDDADCDLGWSIAMLARDYRARVEPVFADVPRGARGYQLLYTVARKRLRTQAQLAEYLGVDRTVIPYVVDDLIDAGLADREQDPRDRRIRTVVVTPRGLEVLQSLQDRLTIAEKALLDPLDDDQKEQLRALLSSIAQRARDSLPDART